MHNKLGQWGRIGLDIIAHRDGYEISRMLGRNKNIEKIPTASRHD